MRLEDADYGCRIETSTGQRFDVYARSPDGRYLLLGDIMGRTAMGYSVLDVMILKRTSRQALVTRADYGQKHADMLEIASFGLWCQNVNATVDVQIVRVDDVGPLFAERQERLPREEYDRERVQREKREREFPHHPVVHLSHLELDPEERISRWSRRMHGSL